MGIKDWVQDVQAVQIVQVVRKTSENVLNGLNLLNDLNLKEEHGIHNSRTNRIKSERRRPWLWRAEPARHARRRAIGGQCAWRWSNRRSISAINFLDTAQNYGTEPILGKAIAGVPRDRLVISTKKTLPAADHAHPEDEVVKGLEQSLKLIGTDYIDVYHLHGVEPKDYSFAKDRLMPAMRRLKEQGKIRFIGVTENFNPDPAHTMLQESLPDDLWDVVMVGFSLAESIGAEDGFAVDPEARGRRARHVCRPARLESTAASALALPRFGR